MYKYKRGINSLNELRQVEYVLSDGYDTCLCMSACLDARKPYNGLYIKNGKIILENVIEKIEIKDKVYKLVELNTSIQSLSCSDYITSVDLDKNIFEYDIGPVSYVKQIVFSKKYRTLCIEYTIKNKERDKVRFKVLPMLTHRDLFNMKTGTLVKFNQRKASYGVIVNLSVMNDENIAMQSKEMTFTNEPRNLNNVKHEYIDENNERNIYTEDVFLPGEFEVVLKGEEEKKVRIYISSEEKVLEKISADYISKEYEATNQLIVDDIDENFIELRELAKGINNFNLDENLVSSLPYNKDYNKVILKVQQDINHIEDIKSDIDVFTDIVKSIDGQYLTFNKVNLANKVLLKIRRYIKNIEALYIKDNDFIKKFMLLKLWYVESINRILQKDNESLLYLDIVKDIVYQSIEYKDILLKEIKFVALVYNAIKIYENILKEKGMEDVNMFDQIIYINNLIKEKFWQEEKRILKKNLDEDELYANVDMIYTLSLSYPCLLEDMPFKLLDTIFKELYTPYGLREFSKNSKYNNGLIYPKYMAYFVKANLRQNGVTRASQKIAYNMVKELIQDIGKYVNGGVKKIYHEKGINIDSIGYDLLTNAEIIRLYDMLT